MAKTETQNEPVFQTARQSLAVARPDLSTAKLEKRTVTIVKDLVLLARCARTKCTITYTEAINLRGHGNPQNGQWLDEAFAHGIHPLMFPDLTMLVVNKATNRPSPGAFEARRTILSDIALEDVTAEQRRCFWYRHYERELGELEPIPDTSVNVRFPMEEPAMEREIARAVDNAIARVQRAGEEKITVGKEYINSLSRSELMALVKRLWQKQTGRCALTGMEFDLRDDEEGGSQHDRVSLDRIDNSLGYSEGNVQLVTQFANRARGTTPIGEARSRLVQFDLRDLAIPTIRKDA
jgi:hypothetical protein